MPAVTVVIPAFNRERFVRRALGSVLAQTYEDFEVIVVDDGSTDSTASLAAATGDRRVRVVMHPENRGRSAARNTAIREARGPYVAFLDSDDIWLPHKLERQVPLLDRGADVVHSLIYVGNRSGDVDHRLSARGFRLFRAVRDADYPYAMVLRKSAWQLNTLVVRRACIDAVGAFDETLPACEDIDFVHRLLRRYRFELVDEPLAVYCNDSDGTSGRELATSWRLLAERELAYVGRELPPDERRAAEAFLFGRLAQSAYILGMPRDALRWTVRALRRDRRGLPAREALRYLVAATLPQPLVGSLRVARRRLWPAAADPWTG